MKNRKNGKKSKADRQKLLIRVVAGACALLMFLGVFAAAFF